MVEGSSLASPLCWSCGCPVGDVHLVDLAYMAWIADRSRLVVDHYHHGIQAARVVPHHSDRSHYLRLAVVASSLYARAARAPRVPQDCTLLEQKSAVWPEAKWACHSWAVEVEAGSSGSCSY